MTVMLMKIYFETVLEETGRKAYICADSISSIKEGYGTGCLWISLKDGKTILAKEMNYVPETTVDMQKLIRLENADKKKIVPLDIIEEIKQKSGMVSIYIIEDYLSSRAFNGMIRGGCSEICYVLSAIENMRMFKWRCVGRKTVQEIIDLFLQMDLIERKDDQSYKPCEGYVSRIKLNDDDSIDTE